MGRFVAFAIKRQYIDTGQSRLSNSLISNKGIITSCPIIIFLPYFQHRSVNKMGRNTYIGKWVEQESGVIDLAFTVDNARVVLADGLGPNSRYTHQDIAHWCERFWNLYCDVDASRDIERIMPILADVETQWDLHLANTYKLEELQKLDFRTVRLPREWFSDWINQLKAEPGDTPNTHSPSALGVGGR